MSGQCLHNRLVDEFERATQKWLTHDHQVANLDALADFLSLWSDVMQAAADGDRHACKMHLEDAAAKARSCDAGKHLGRSCQRVIVRYEDL